MWKFILLGILCQLFVTTSSIVDDPFVKFQLQKCHTQAHIKTCVYNNKEPNHFYVNVFYKVIDGIFVKYYSVDDVFTDIYTTFGRRYDEHFPQNIKRDLVPVFDTGVLNARNIYSAEEIVIKRSGSDRGEINCLKSRNIYVSHMDDVILMKKVNGVTYDEILQDVSYPWEKLIEIHKAINEEFQKFKTLQITHGGSKPSHIFVSELSDNKYKIDIVDYNGKCIPNTNSAMKDFNDLNTYIYNLQDKYTFNWEFRRYLMDVMCGFKFA